MRKFKMHRVFCAAFFLLALPLALARGDKSMKVYEVEVSRGATIWEIAGRYLRDPKLWPKIVEQNSDVLKDQFFVFPGTRLKLLADLVADDFSTARVVELVNQVWVRTPGNFTWLAAYRNMSVFDGEVLKSGGDGQVRVHFSNRDILIVGGDSAVILRTKDRMGEVNLLSGEAIMRASETRIVTPTASIEPTRMQSIFKARVDKDSSTVVQVESGQTSVTSRKTGGRFLVNEGFANVVRADGGNGPMVTVPDLPELKLAWVLDPRLKKVYEEKKAVAAAKFLASSPAVSAKAGRESGGGVERNVFGGMEPLAGLPAIDPVHDSPKWRQYRLQVARDGLFRVIERQYLKKTVPGKRVMDLAQDYQLPNGNYYRRVAYVDDSGKETQFYTLPVLVLNTSSPPLSIDTPSEGMKTDKTFLTVQGKSKPGYILTVNGMLVEINQDGSFTWGVMLSRLGANKIRVVVRDLKKNQTFLERTVQFGGE